MSKRVSFHTLGCRLNQAETASLQQRFRQLGYEVVAADGPADYCVVHTCTVTANGDAATRRLVRRLAHSQPGAGIALIGCQAQLQAAALARLENVRWVVGNARKMDLPELMAEGDPESPRIVAGPIPRANFVVPGRSSDGAHTRASLKIQDGCDFFCGFCTIPHARGPARSRVFADVLREAAELLAAGHQELVLTGVNVGTYADSGRSLVDVVTALAGLPGLRRLRISSIEPTTIALELLDRMLPQGPLCRHLHIPLQSGSDELLRRMNRRYTLREYCDFAGALLARQPELCLGTDVLTGYPGESPAHFAETLACLEELPLAYLHVFSYSDRDLARSRSLPDKVPPAEIAARSRQLRALGERKRRQWQQRFLGQTVEILGEGHPDNGYWSGLTDHFLRVRVRSERPLRNRFATVRLERCEEGAMLGVLV